MGAKQEKKIIFNSISRGAFESILHNYMSGRFIFQRWLSYTCHWWMIRNPSTILSKLLLRADHASNLDSLIPILQPSDRVKWRVIPSLMHIILYAITLTTHANSIEKSVCYFCFSYNTWIDSEQVHPSKQTSCLHNTLLVLEFIKHLRWIPTNKKVNRARSKRFENAESPLIRDVLHFQSPTTFICLRATEFSTTPTCPHSCGLEDANLWQCMPICADILLCTEDTELPAQENNITNDHLPE